MKVMTRLQNITYLQTLLEKALSGNSVNARLSQPPQLYQWSLTWRVFQGRLVLFHLLLILTVTARTFLYPVLLHLWIRQRKVTLCIWLNKTAARQLTGGFVFFRRRWEEAQGPWSESFRKHLSAGRHDHWRQNPAGKCAALIFAVLTLTSHAWCEAWLLLQEQPEKEKENRHGTILVSYRAFFRELDMEVLKMLQYGLLSRSLLDSEQQTNVRPLLYSLGGESPLFMGFYLNRINNLLER